jgi:hypothetical protein
MIRVVLVARNWGGGVEKLHKMMFIKPEKYMAFAIFRVPLKDNIKIHLK